LKLTVPPVPGSVTLVSRFSKSQAYVVVPVESTFVSVLPPAKSFGDGTGDDESREPCEQEKERRFGLFPIKGNVDELKNWKE
jgi:hypothetical protein